ncbi:MAG: hypothetical protein ACW967_01005 [Candidatus Hodarchaeales archaeon]|jgi:hypothetical protein
MAGDTDHASEVSRPPADPFPGSFWWIIPSLMFIVGVLFLFQIGFSVIYLNPNFDSVPYLIVWFFLTFLISAVIYILESISSLKKSLQDLSDKLDQLTSEDKE